MTNSACVHVFMPPAVQAELRSTVPGLTACTPAHAPLVTALITQLGPDEPGAIALAVELGDAWLILDDKKARAVARQMGLRVIGTVGILLRAKRLGLVSRIEPVLTALHEARFRMGPALRRQALRLASEEPAG